MLLSTSCPQRSWNFGVMEKNIETKADPLNRKLCLLIKNNRETHRESQTGLECFDITLTYWWHAAAVVCSSAGLIRTKPLLLIYCLTDRISDKPSAEGEAGMSSVKLHSLHFSLDQDASHFLPASSSASLPVTLFSLLPFVSGLWPCVHLRLSKEVQRGSRTNTHVNAHTSGCSWSSPLHHFVRRRNVCAWKGGTEAVRARGWAQPPAPESERGKPSHRKFNTPLHMAF